MALLFLALLGLALVALFYCLVLGLSYKVRIKRKVTPFERGFIRVGRVQGSFSVHFFLILLVFIIFDLEIILFLGLLIRTPHGLLVFLTIWPFVIGGLYLEWALGKLSWIV